MLWKKGIKRSEIEGKCLEIEGGYAIGATTFWENHPMWTKVGYAGPSNAKATQEA